MRFFRYLVAIFIFSLAAAAQAASDDGKLINILRVDSSGNVIVAMMNTTVSTANCPWTILSVGNLSASSANRTQVQAEFSMLMAAKMSNRPISIGYTGCNVDFVHLY